MAGITAKFTFTNVRFQHMMPVIAVIILISYGLNQIFPILLVLFTSALLGVLLMIFFVNRIKSSVRFYEDYLVINKAFSRDSIVHPYDGIERLTFKDDRFQTFILETAENKYLLPPPVRPDKAAFLDWCKTKGLPLEIVK